MNIGKQIETLMEITNISQKALAKDLNIASSTLNGYIKDRRQPNFEILVEIAKYFSVSCDYLLGFNKQRSDTQINNEFQLLSQYRLLSSEQKDLILHQLKYMNSQNSKKQEKKSSAATSGAKVI
ncbi:MAG: helix-turn-helix transcriptional regulator [Clostridia bacterium]